MVPVSNQGGALSISWALRKQSSRYHATHHCLFRCASKCNGITAVGDGATVRASAVEHFELAFVQPRLSFAAKIAQPFACPSVVAPLSCFTTPCQATFA